jgi:uncharacterized protein (UPF0262 family)
MTMRIILWCLVLLLCTICLEAGGHPRGRFQHKLSLLAQSIRTQRSCDNSDSDSASVHVLERNKFENIRAHFSINEESYWKSICDMSEDDIDTSSRSRQSFRISRDGQYMVKTVHSHEAKTLLQILDDYYNHICQGKPSCIVPVVGLYKISEVANPSWNLLKTVKRWIRGRPENDIYLIVSRNVFSGSDTLSTADSLAGRYRGWPLQHGRFDLKGSAVGRIAKKRSVLGKDIDLQQSNVSFSLSREQYAYLSEAVARDAGFFRVHNIMDYSLLLGITPTAESLTSALLAHTRSRSIMSVFLERERDSDKLR